MEELESREDALKARFKKIIQERKFTEPEWRAFHVDPNVALLAGMTIGYKFGMEEAQKTFIDICLSRVSLS
jgi:hypothetical protein